MAEFLTMPKLSPTMSQGVISSWLIDEGKAISPGQALFEASTDKAVVEHAALDGGYLRKVLVPAGSSAAVGAPIAIIAATLEESITALEEEWHEQQVPPEEPMGDEPEEAAPLPSAAAPVSHAEIYPPVYDPPAARACVSPPRLSPRARHIADEQGLDVRPVAGSGQGGRVLEEDLQWAGQQVPLGKPSPAAPGQYRTEALSATRRTIAKRLQASKQRIPHFYLDAVVEITQLEQLRTSLKREGLALSVNDFLMRAVACALREHPRLNVGYDETSDACTVYESVDLAVAVQTPQGLVTPIIWQADGLNLRQLSHHARGLFTRAREGKLLPGAIMGGSFTLSNLGGYGVHKVTPIINPPQGAILGVGAPLPWLLPAKWITLTLGADHRLIDGADGAAFLQRVVKLIETPAVLLME